LLAVESDINHHRSKQAERRFKRKAYSPTLVRFVLSSLVANYSDAYFEIFVGATKIYKSEVSKDTTSPSWKPFVIGLAQVGGLDNFFTIKVWLLQPNPAHKTQLWNWYESGKRELIGELSTTLREWTFGSYQQAFKNNGR
jgi:hypothetical protein